MFSKVGFVENYGFTVNKHATHLISYHHWVIRASIVHLYMYIIIRKHIMLALSVTTKNAPSLKVRIFYPI